MAFSGMCVPGPQHYSGQQHRAGKAVAGSWGPFCKPYKLLLGDFNFPDIEWEDVRPRNAASDATVAFVESINDAFLTQHVEEPT